MAFFKSRKSGAEPPSAPSQPESVEAMRKRAKHRLIGAGVLVLIGVVGFPLLFDTQPRPIAVDIPIEIPDRNKVKPLPVPAQASLPATGTTTASASAAGTANVSAASKAQGDSLPLPLGEGGGEGKQTSPAAAVPVAPPLVVAVPKPETRPETKVASKPEAKPEPPPAPKPEPKVAAKSDDGAKAKALLEGKSIATASSPAAAEGRFVVQVGAYADATKARETRLKVEKAGLKTYTHVAETKDGKRIRVRVGPFATRGEADKAASKIKGLDLPAAILTL